MTALAGIRLYVCLVLGMVLAPCFVNSMEFNISDKTSAYFVADLLGVTELAYAADLRYYFTYENPTGSSSAPLVLLQAEREELFQLGSRKCFQRELVTANLNYMMHLRSMSAAQPTETYTLWTRGDKCTNNGSHTNCIGRIYSTNGWKTRWTLGFGYICGDAVFNSPLRVSYELSVIITDNVDCRNFTETLPFQPRVFNCWKFYNRYTNNPTIGMVELYSLLQQFSPIIKTYLNCYQHFEELYCGVFFPKCSIGTIDTGSYPCRRMLEDYNAGCDFGSYEIVFNLPDDRKNQICAYKPVSCSVPKMSNGTQVVDRDVFNAGEVLSVKCLTGYHPTGRSVATCLHTGEWDYLLEGCGLNPETVVAASDKYVIWKILSPCLVVILLVALLIFAWYKYNFEMKAIVMTTAPVRKWRMRGSRNDGAIVEKDFDFFVSYSSADINFVRSSLFRNLGEMNPPSYELCLEDRNFLPGDDLSTCYITAISKSKGAILLLSQAYIDDDNCKYQFDRCYNQAVNDANFKCIIVLLNKFESFTRVSRDMQRFYKERVCILHTDPLIWRKIEATYGPSIITRTNIYNINYEITMV